MTKDEPKTFPEDLCAFIASVHWTPAKTTPLWPHEYIFRGWVDERMFIQLVAHFRAIGFAGRFYSKPITYFDHDGMTYWTIGAPLEETVIINRCRKEKTYEEQLKEGRLLG